jgi:hypothetical protein
MGATYTEAQARATAAYEARTFRKILFRFRLDEDADIIASHDEAMEHGIRKIDWFRSFFDENSAQMGKVRRAMERAGIEPDKIEQVLKEI